MQVITDVVHRFHFSVWISVNMQKICVPSVIYKESKYSRLWGKHVYRLDHFSCSTDPLFWFSDVMICHWCLDKSDLQILNVTLVVSR